MKTSKRIHTMDRAARRNEARALGTIGQWRLRKRERISHRVQVDTVDGEPVYETHYQVVVI
jgi:hypothetical protein